MRGPNQYPDQMPEMKAAVEDYMKEAGKVGAAILQGFA
jgi:isopenicillin N synthase-like dioxygenase